MKTSGPDIITELREKLQFNIGRHLYGILGSYQLLGNFELNGIAQSTLPSGEAFPSPVNLSRHLLANIKDDDLKKLIRDEGRRPQAIKRALNYTLNNTLAKLLIDTNVLILKNLELVFAYDLDLSLFRTRATNQNHILLLLPGERRSDHITIFHEANVRSHRSLPQNLIADNHLWELSNG